MSQTTIPIVRSRFGPLTQKIRSLSAASRFALVDATERFWKEEGDQEA